MKKSILFFFLLYSTFSFGQTYNPNEKGNFFVSTYSRSFLNADWNNWGVFQDKDGIYT